MRAKLPVARRIKKPETGARVQKTRIGDRWQSYLAHHRSSGIDSLRRLLATPLQSLLTWLVIAVALALPAVMLVGLDNLQSLGQRWDGAPKITLFLDRGARAEAVQALQQQLQQDARVQSLQLVTPEQALQDFERDTGVGQALRLLDSNPLPATLILTPAANLAPQQLVALGESLDAEAIVDDVILDRAWIERLHYLLQLGQQLVWTLGGLLGLGVVLVIGNTIRLAIENRRDEIVVIKLVGGSSGFVRRPFLYTGLWYGGIGGLLALAMLLGFLWFISGPVSTLAQAYQSDFRLRLPGASLMLALVLGGGLTGWLGAWLAVGRHLGEIEPK